jgi:hypothetical protein
VVVFYNTKLGVYVGDKYSPDDTEATTAQLAAAQALIDSDVARALADESAKNAAIVNPVIQYLER